LSHYLRKPHICNIILAYKFGNNSKKWLGSSYKTPVQPLMKSQSLNHKSRPYYPEQTIVFHSCSKFCMISLRKKSKTILLSPCRYQGEEEYSSYSFLTSALHGVSGQCHATAALYPRYPLDTRLGRPQSWSGHRGQGKNPLPLPGIEPQSSTILTELPQLLCNIRYQTISATYSLVQTDEIQFSISIK
jgi:hypothetical protein